MVLVRLLGPVDVLDDSGRTRVPQSPIRRTLLALLATASGQPVDAAALLERAWAGNPPASGRRALRFHISRLREEVGDGVVRTVPGGYELDAEVDVALVEAGARAATAAAAELESLLGLWRGDPLTGTQPCAELEHERERLDALRLSLTERFFEGRIAAGQAAEVVEDLIRSCRANPLREKLWRLRIHAHAELGQQAAALRSFDEIHAALVETLGAVPGPELQEAHRRVLDGPVAGHETTSPSPGSPRPDLLGRTADLDGVNAALAASPVVTITGVGGVGKTSLAELLAHDQRANGRPVAFVELAPLGASHDVVGAVAKAAGVTRPVTGIDDLASVLGRQDDLLVVLDNCEHVTGVTAELAGVLAHVPVRVLATSRAPLGVAGERVVRLAPLAELDDAVALFMREADRRDARLPADEATTAVIRAICEELDGLPLAIELAAARTPSLGLEQLRDHLTTVLSDTRHRPGDRHTTMTATLQWSTVLLEPAMTHCLGALSVFAGSFDLPAAAAVLAVVGELPAVDVIDELVNRSLVESAPLGTTRRYRLLEPVRQFAQTHLVDDLATLRDIHLEHYLERLEEAYVELASTGDEPLSTLVEHDLANLGAVHRWALDRGRVDDDLRLYRPLLPYIFWHEVYTPCGWATETSRAHGRSLSTRDRTLLTIAQARPHREGNIDVEPAVLYEAADSATDQAAHQLLLLTAVWADTLLGNAERAQARWEQVDRSDAHTNFLYWYIGVYARVHADDIAAAARNDLEAGIRWATAVGARNFEAALRQRRAEFECLYGDPQLGSDLARSAETLARRAGMTFAAGEATLSRAIAGFRGARTNRTPAMLLREVLVSALTTECGSLARIGIGYAAPVLLSHGEQEAAALAHAHRAEKLMATNAQTEDTRALVAIDGDPPAGAAEMALFEVTGAVIGALDRVLAHEGQLTVKETPTT